MIFDLIRHHTKKAAAKVQKEMIKDKCLRINF